jgi:uncharacterized protein (TIGR02246 family)
MCRWILWAILAVPGVAWADAAEDVAAATRAWAAAYNSHDPQQILVRYAADAVFWGTGSETLRYSRAAILDYFRNMPNRPNARVSIGDHRVRVYGDIAINTGLYTFTDVVDDASVTRPARFSFTYRLHNGEWLIVDHHSSRVPAASP